MSSAKIASKQLVLVDHRERPSGLMDALQIYPNLDLKEEYLSIGDIVVGDLLIERKTISDLVASLADGRLFRQLFAMKRENRKTLLLIEGQNAGDLDTIVPNFLRNVLLRIATSMQIPVVRTKDVTDSASVILIIANQVNKVTQRPAGPPQQLKPTSLSAQQLFVLASLPHIGRVRPLFLSILKPWRGCLRLLQRSLWRCQGSVQCMLKVLGVYRVRFMELAIVSVQ